MLARISPCPELLLNHNYLCPSLMSSVTALLPLPLEQAAASGSLRVSLLQHLHFVIRASSPHLIKIYSLQPARKSLFVPPGQLHHTGGAEGAISHLIAPKQGPLGGCSYFKALMCQGGVARSQLRSHSGAKCLSNTLRH